MNPFSNHSKLFFAFKVTKLFKTELYYSILFSSLYILSITFSFHQYLIIIAASLSFYPKLHFLESHAIFLQVTGSFSNLNPVLNFLSLYDLTSHSCPHMPSPFIETTLFSELLNWLLTVVETLKRCD